MARLTGRETVGSTKEHLEALNQVTAPGTVYVEENTGVLRVGDGVTHYLDATQIGGNSSSLTEAQEEVLSHWEYDPVSRKLISDRAIETTLNSLYLGEQHKISSGAANIFFTNLGTDTNHYPMWGGLKDQALSANQGASGFIAPQGRVYTDMFNLPLGGEINTVSAI